MEKLFGPKRFVPPKTKKIIIAFGFIVVSIYTATISYYYYSARQEKTLEKSYYSVFNVRIPKKLYFANEKVPVENPLVRERIARQIIKSSKWKKEIRLLQKRSAKWFPVIEPILKKHNIPDDFKYLAVVESALTNGDTSHKGASGFWQFMDETASEFGLEINAEIDERLDVQKSTHAACKYFNYAYSQLNSWILVAASYNKGITGLQRQLKKQGKNDYFQLHLNKETGRYLYKIIAIKEILSKPQVYGIKPLKK